MSDGDRPVFSILNAGKIERIVAEAFHTLDKVGVLVDNREAIEILAGAGARVSDDGGRVFLSRSLCEECLRTVPRDFVLYDREGDAVTRIGGPHTVFDPGSAAISIFDFAERRVRKPDTRDVIEFARLTDRLHAFDAQSTAVVPADVPEKLADRYRLFLALIYGGKPIVTGTFTKEAFSTMLSFLTTVRGDGQSLKDKPLAIFDCCPSPPLMWSDLTCQSLMDCARHSVPAQIVSMPLAGATGPVTLAGSVVQHTAETLSGIVIHQTVNPGAPLVYGGAAACFDMRKGTTPMGAVETMMIDTAYVEVGRSLGMPTHVYMGLSDAKSPDFQAGFETAMGVTLAALAGANLVSGPGMLNFVSCQSLEKLVLDNEICAMAKRLLRGVELREPSLGFEILRDVAGGKSFLTSDHTRRFFREEVYYPSDVVDRSPESDWGEEGAPTAAERAHAKVIELLKDSSKNALAPRAIADELERIMLSDAKQHGMDKLPDWRAMLR